jgi:YD repeat-containing protein
MRGWLLSFLFTTIVFSARSQFYFKDLVMTGQNQKNWKTYRDQKVKEVTILSRDASGEPTPGFTCSQEIASDYHSIITYTHSTNISPSTLTAFYDPQGRLVKTTDTSDTYKSTTEYSYAQNGQVGSMTNTSVQTDNQVSASEQHLWTYEGNRPVSMLKIKDGTDTTRVQLIADEKGNIVEEKSMRHGQNLPSVYYYYDDQNRLTDVVRYSQKAKRLLPDYVFEWAENRISSMLFVPEGSNDYQKWVYQYDARGLKSTEICFDRKKQVVVRIDYNYQFR